MGISTTDIWMILRARDEASRTVRSLGRSFGNLDRDALTAANRQMERGRALSSMGAGMIATGAAGFIALESLGKGAREYDAQARAALTQTDNVNTSLKEMKDLGLSVARELPVAFEQVQPALYDIFSSIDTNMKGAGKLVRQFGKDAIAGNTDMETAGRANLQVMNAYSIGVDKASDVSDFFFQLVRKGVGTYGEMTAAVGKAIPSASRAGQSYQTLGSMIAFMTRNGTNAAQAGTSAARAMDAIANPKTLDNMKEMGIQITDASGNFLDMDQIVRNMNGKLEGLSETAKSAKLKEMFAGSGGTIQAMKFFNAVTKNDDALKSYMKRVKEMKNAKGAAGEAFNIMKNSDQAKQQQAVNNLKAMRVELGEVYNVVRGKILVALGDLANWFNNAPDWLKKTIVYFTLFASAIAVIAGIGLVLAGMFAMVGAAATTLGIGVGALIGIFAGVIAVIALVAAAGYLIYKNWDKIGPYLANIWSNIVSGAKAAWSGMVSAAKAAWDWIERTFGSDSDIGQAAIKAFDHVKSKMKELISSAKDLYNFIKPQLDDIGAAFSWLGEHAPEALQKIGQFLQWLAPYIQGIASAVIAFVVPMIQSAISIIGTIFGAIIQLINNAIQTIQGVLMILKGIFTGDFGMIKDGVLMIFNAMWNSIKTVFMAGVNIVKSVVTGFVDSIIGFFTHLWDVLVGHSIIPDMINAIVRWFKSLPGKVLSGIASFVSSIISFFASLPGKAKSALSSLGGKLWDAVTNGFTRFKAGAQEGWNKSKDYIKSIPGKIKDIFNDLPGQLKDVGLDIIGGLAQGIVDGGVAALKKAKNVAGNIKDGIKGVFRSKSPSKVMIQLGRDITAGIMIGMKGTESQAVAAAKSMSNKIISAIRKPVRHGTKKKGYYYTMDGLTKKEALAAVKLVGKYDDALIANAKKRDANLAKIGNAKKALADAQKAYQDYYDKVSQSIRDYGKITDITDAFGGTEFLTKDDLKKGLQDKLTDITNYTDTLKKLLKDGLSGDIYQQLLDAGVESGGAYVQALATMSPSELTEFNNLNAQVGAKADALGKQAADKFYKAGVVSAQGYLNGLLKDQAALDRAADQLADRMLKRIKKKLGIKSPSRVFLGIGRNLTQAMASGMLKDVSMLENASAKLTDAANVDGGPYFGDPFTGQGTTGSGLPTPVDPQAPASVFNQEITIHTNEIDPKANAAQLGFELYQRGV